eukprot:9467474-Pyramimonas_sp.AAC.1
MKAEGRRYHDAVEAVFAEHILGKLEHEVAGGSVHDGAHELHAPLRAAASGPVNQLRGSQWTSESATRQPANQ